VRVPGRTDIRALIALGAIALIAGAILVALASGTVLMVIGIALLGLAAIAFVSLAFLLVGQSEERDRQRHPRG
jgi:MFS family permease